MGSATRADFEHCDVGAVPRQEPVALALDPARARHAQGDRRRSGAHADRDRSAPHRDRRARRHPPRGAAGHRRVAAGRAARAARRRRRDRSRVPRRARRGRRAPHRSRRARRASRSPTRSRAPGSTRRWCAAPPRVIGRREGVRELRGSRRADEPPLDAGQLPAPAADPADRQLRQAGHALHPDDAGQRHGRRGQAHEPGRRRAHRRRPRPVQLDRRRDPDRSSEALSRDAGRGGEPGALARRSPADARGARGPRHAGGDRRRDDRDRAARPLRAPCRDPVREGRGHVLQLRLPRELLSSAPAAVRRRPTARCPRPRSTRGSSRRSARSTRPTSPRCAPPRSRA